MIVQILKAISALPALVQMLKDLGQWMEEVKLDEWLEESQQTFNRLKVAETSEDKMQAAKDIQSLIRKL